MWGFMTQVGIATTTVDFTTDLSVLGVGLLGALALAAGMITVSALRYAWSQAAQPATEATVAPMDYRQAA